MKIVNEVLYKNLEKKLREKYKNKAEVEYVDVIFKYANNWADEMERAIDNGKELRDVAVDLSFKSKPFYISKEIYSEAVKVLVCTWFRGEELRRIHNAKYNYSGEGIVN